MASPIIVRLELTPSAKKALEGLTDQKRMTQTALLSRLVEWMAHQPSAVHAAVLAHTPTEATAETAKLMFQRTGKK